MYDEREKLIQDLKDLCHNTVPYLIDFAVGIGMGLLISLLFGLPFVFIRDLNMNVIRFIFGFPGMCVALYRRCFKRSYHANSRTYAFSLKKSAKHIGLTFVAQSLLVMVLGAHAIYVTGPTYWITDVLFSAASRSDMGGHFLREGYDWLLMFLSDIIFYGPVMVYGEYVGYKERKKDYQLETQEYKL